MNSWYTAQELAGLPGLPTTPRAIRNLAQRAKWNSQRRIGSKASEYAFASLPCETQSALLAKAVGDISTIDNAERDADSSSRLNDKQRSVMTARIAFVREIEQLSKLTSQRRAIATLLSMIESGELSPYLVERLERANDRKTSNRNLSERTLKRWLSDYKQHGESGLAPARRKMDMTVPKWATDFLLCYQRPTKPSVEASYAEFAGKHSNERPSIHQVRRFLNKLSAEVRERGRRSPQELKALQPFKRRTTKSLLPCDVFTADGHKFDAEVLNPRTGKPYRPEVTTVLDVATRKALGISIGEAESTIGVMDALRDAMKHGMFAFFYVDNGSGFANDTVREVVDRLGGTMSHALPYNSQARGLIERSHQTIWVNAAKKLPSYIGADMDKHAGTKVHRIGRKELRETGKTRLIPTFPEFMSGVEYEIETYNNYPHRGLAKLRDSLTGKIRHMSPNEAWSAAIAAGWEPIVAPAELLNDLTRPQVIRPTRRGEVIWAGETYFLDALRNFQGEQIRLAYDVRDSSRVWVRTLDGELIGEAILDGNASDYMPKSMIEKAYDKREKGQMKRAVDKLEALTGRRVEMITTSPAPSADLSTEELAEAQRFATHLIAPKTNRFELPNDPISRYRLWKALDRRLRDGEPLNEEERLWHERYPRHLDFTAIKRMYEHTSS
ncbi:DDE-type integrase/transposase/recombinase [Pseudomonas yamanorum]|nr:DDE-type integrase/transposase/recombinase [Pseudomonas yamanorum]QLG94091.1 DDE-type integrase/transposase/recombinase [Pseudomonas yamanorum]